MNKLLSVILFLTVAGISVNGFSDDGGGSDDDGSHKALICHKGETLSVGEPGVIGHVGHGDSEGSCEDADGPKADVEVVTMKCEADEGVLKVTAYSSSVDFAVPPLSEVRVGSDCADALADLLNNGFEIESVTGNTDYLLLGETD